MLFDFFLSLVVVVFSGSTLQNTVEVKMTLFARENGLLLLFCSPSYSVTAQKRENSNL